MKYNISPEYEATITTSYPEIPKVVEAIQKATGVSIEQIRCPSHIRLYCLARQLLCALLPNVPRVILGEFMYRDHSTVCYYIKKAADAIKYDADLKKLYDNTLTHYNIISNV